jgi:dTDP-4-dehydrorhamnose 3,5-epimerase
MRVLDTQLNGVKIIEPACFGDNRGYFLETFNAERYQKAIAFKEFVQDNFSFSQKGVVRGLHLQNPIQQGKLVMVLSGKVLDAAVDVRVGSPTFGKFECFILDDSSHRQLWIPRGFAHGFAVLSAEAKLMYKCDAPYNRESEICIRWNDPEIAIDWGIEDPVLSDKDAAAPLLGELKPRLPRYKD